MRKLNLDQLCEGLPEITPRIGAFFAEAAAVCLTLQGHKTGVTLKIEGDFEAVFELNWTIVVDDKVKSGWRDLKETVEYGATAIAILAMKSLTEFDSFERAEQKERCDYFLKNPKGKVESEARLEISGILTESGNNSINLRIISKEKQATNTGLNIPTFITVVEFSTPKAKIIKR